ncbi:sensor histidine kinase [Clostridium grantii]|uniref:histidine kinase n=1 Tax=Clostridium grantii DSM 8605 TaxID=1121316 RepID=A0A1M5VL31_9CLOT|nr:sensor histidine kinase [Clostridium grantii]SHH75754.1 hypothetical protein SAMN02745207_02317 [Clostridium grantii DSM 8605]
MKFLPFVKEKVVFIILQVGMIAFLAVMLSFYQVSGAMTFLICFILCLIAVTSFTFEYYNKNKFYKNLYQNLNDLSKKHYISTMVEIPDFEEGVILTDVLQQSSKSMNDEIATFRHISEDYKDYIEAWIHEIKLPIACVDLICENNKDEVTANIREELKRIDSFVEQALYYARSTYVEKDYVLKEISLNDLVRSSVKKHSKQLIGAKASLSLNDLDINVYGDSKWLDFILGQIISNAIKYKREDLSISFYARENKENSILYIDDNGIGISETDIDRVFEKGFTGENGRKFTKSTGIGLYLCKKLCDKMYLGFEITSKIGLGTTIKIIFPKDSRLLLL